MTNPAGATGNEFRVVYWGPEGSDGGRSLESIAENWSFESRCELKRIRTRLDPSLHYEELSLHPNGLSGDENRTILTAVPTHPELSVVRLQLLDGVDAIILVISQDEREEQTNRASVDELRRALAAYGRDLQSLPLAVQYAPAETSSTSAPEKTIAALQISPIEVHESAGSRPTSCHEVLESVLEVLREAAAHPEKSTSAGLDRFGLAPEEDPWLATADPDLPGDDRAIKTLLETSMLAEEDPDPAQLADDDPFGPPSASPGAIPGRQATEIGPVERSGKRGIRLPLVLPGPSGEPVPMALHIELEIPGDED